MATNTFERKIVISSEDAQQKLKKVLESDTPARKLTVPPFTDAERKRSEALLARYWSHSKR